MKKFFMNAALYVAALTMATSFAACSSDDSSEAESGVTNTGGVATDGNTYATELVGPTGNADFTNRQYGQAAIDSCADIVDDLDEANTIILSQKLNDEQEAFLKQVVAGVVDNVIIPTYTEMADKAEAMEQALLGLNAATVTQADIDEACKYFGETRVLWERSEAFLGGAASDFSVDPTIDSWPLSRSKLLEYLKGNMSPEELEDETILGFHALEFILFRNGQPRKVSEIQGTDSYKGFEGVSGEKELVYAQQVCKLLKERTFQLQVAWEGETEANKSRMEVVKAAGLDYVTEKGLSFGEDMKMAGDSKSKYPTLKDAITQILAHDEGSASAIANEVGTAKIANPFSQGEISYVESPYSYRSIIDFMDNIRSIRNVWYGNTTGQRDASNKSFYSYFLQYNNSMNLNIVNTITNTINTIAAMPDPFVKYCCTIWGKEFSDVEYVEPAE